MTDSLTAAEYDRLVQQLASHAIAEMRERDDVPTDDLARLEMNDDAVQQCIEKAVLLTSYEAFDDETLAAYEDEMSATMAGSIIDHAEAQLPEERFNTHQWDSSLHVQRIASNYLYADAKRGVTRRLREQASAQPGAA